MELCRGREVRGRCKVESRGRRGFAHVPGEAEANVQRRTSNWGQKSEVGRCSESIVEILVRADPNPNGGVAFAPTHRTIAAAKAHGPESPGAVEFLEAQAGMIWIIEEKQECVARLVAGGG